MAANIAHVFVRAPSEQVESACRRWAKRRQAGVHLIPAEGGCFIVVAPARPPGASLFSWLPRLASAGRVSRRELERFRAELESASP